MAVKFLQTKENDQGIEDIIIEFNIPDDQAQDLNELRRYFYRFCASLGYDVYVKEDSSEE